MFPRHVQRGSKFHFHLAAISPRRLNAEVMPVVARLRQVYCYAQANSVFPLQRRWKTYAIARDTGVGLPANSDLLDRYKGLVALGHIQQDEEQLRVVMQV